MQDQGAGRLDFLLRPLSLAGRRRPTFSLWPHVALALCVHIPVSLRVRLSGSHKGTSQIGLGPIPMASFYLITSLKVPTCPESRDPGQGWGAN